WESEASFLDFRARFEREYDELDRKCERLTESETRIGAFAPAVTERFAPSRPTATVFERRHGDVELSSDVRRLDLELGHGWLVRSYWSPGIPRPVLERGIESSLCFGLYRGDRQLGFARMITDRASYAYLADVYIDEEHRGHGLGAWFVRTILEHPDLQGL